MACITCYRDWISCGVEEIVLNTGVDAITEYTVTISTPQGRTYNRTYTSNVFGDITIPVSTFPLALFNPYAGLFSISIKIGCDYLLFCDEYACIEFEVRNGDSKNTLSCCPSGGEMPTTMQCCTTENVTFVNEAVTVIPYIGARPMIEVAYLQPDNTFSLSVGTSIVFSDSEFTIDHGGPASGVIKLLK